MTHEVKRILRLLPLLTGNIGDRGLRSRFSPNILKGTGDMNVFAIPYSLFTNNPLIDRC